ncbi:hypothetical protein LMH87_001978 [Akanthomyces muscarius]|uniref:Uncharacterized protein n=1 Tax=Akanthomyces muscarius TaxID=2231603 RepID=A0A9W8Q5Y8_AKAMU|nr:hypothetical protein LMH87_001978 [Akanthomyces muscarius]KAJ4147463.1 hypothetical protein LMH87_001978 [Akanthomyces muscarius]
MILSSVLGVLLAALPVWAGLVSFAVPDTIKDGDEITVIVTMNSELGSVWDYNLVLSATERSLPYGYLGGRGFAMIDLRGLPFGTSNFTVNTKDTGVGAREDSVVRGAWLSTVGVMGMLQTRMQQVAVKRGSRTSKNFVDSKPLLR